MKRNLWLAVALLLVGCTKYVEPVVEDSPESQIAITRSSGLSGAGNPYSLSNVQIAFDEIAHETRSDSYPLEPTHLYVRFHPEDSLQFTMLHDTLPIDLFTYPLDEELTDDQILAYQDDSLKLDGYLWEYASVPIDFQMPSWITCEVLDSTYIQPEMPVIYPMSAQSSTQSASSGTNNFSPSQLSGQLWELVLQRAMENTGHLSAQEQSGPQTRGLFGSPYYPSARITFEDDGNNNQTIPLQGVKVRVHHFVNVGSKFTDQNGETGNIQGWGGRFRYPVRYQIIWEDDKWNIRDNRTGQAEYSGPKQREKWYFRISGDTRTAMEAAVHRALYAYYYGNYPLAAGITKCRMNKMNVGVMYNDSKSGEQARFAAWHRTLWGNSILLYGISNNTGQHITHAQATCNMFHELGHATHWQAVIDMPGINRNTHYNLINDNVADSWANAVEYAYARSLFPTNFRDHFNSYTPQYSGIGEALMNQGLTLKQIERSVVGVTHWDEWRNNVKSLGSINPRIVDMLFNDPVTIWEYDFNHLITGPSESFTSSYVTYKLPLSFQGGIQYIDWSVSGGGYEIIGEGGWFVTLRFTTEGSRTLTGRIRLPDGTAYENQITINIQPSLGGEITSQQIILNRFQCDYLSIESIHAPTFSGISYRWEMNYGEGWVLFNSSGQASLYRELPPCHFRTIIRRVATTQAGVSSYSNECEVINYAFEGIDTLVDEFNPIVAGSYDADFTYSLLVDTNSKLFRDISLNPGREAWIDLDLACDMEIELTLYSCNLGGLEARVYPYTGVTDQHYCCGSYPMYEAYEYGGSDIMNFSQINQLPTSHIFPLFAGRYMIMVEGFKNSNGGGRYGYVYTVIKGTKIVE